MDIKIRDLVYGLVSIPFVKSYRILLTLDLLDKEDRSHGCKLKIVNIIGKVIQKAKDKNCLEELYLEIKKIK